MTAPARVNERRRVDGFLAFASLGAPVAWAAQLLVVYALDEGGCAPVAPSVGEVFGVEAQTTAVVAAAAFAVVAALGTVAAWRCDRRQPEPGATGERRVIIARVSVGVSGLFTLLALFGVIAAGVLEPCA